MSLSRALAEKGMEVLVIDSKLDRIRLAGSFATEALCFDATDSEALAQTSPASRDFCVCAIGDDSRESSIICTALLRQLGARRVIARANGQLHARILSLVGAHEVVDPVREFAERYSNRLLYERLIGEMPLGEGLVITELRAPPVFLGRTLAELRLPDKYGVTVVAVRSEGSRTIVLPTASFSLKKDDVLIVVSREEDVTKLMERT